MKTSPKISIGSTRYINAAVLALLALTVVPLTAQAAEPSEATAKSEVVLERTVSYGDLDIDSPAGARVLLARLRRAARDVCPLPDVRDIKGQDDWRKCYERAVTSAVARINASAVSALYAKVRTQSPEG